MLCTNDEVADSMRKVSVCVLGHIRGSRTRFMLSVLTTLMPQPRRIHSLGFGSSRVELFAPHCSNGLLNDAEAVFISEFGSGDWWQRSAGASPAPRRTYLPRWLAWKGMPGMETMPCCKKNQSASVDSESSVPEQCCINTQQETGSGGTTFNLRSPSFSVAIHPAVHSVSSDCAEAITKIPPRPKSFYPTYRLVTSAIFPF